MEIIVYTKMINIRDEGGGKKMHIIFVYLGNAIIGSVGCSMLQIRNKCFDVTKEEWMLSNIGQGMLSSIRI